MIDLKFDRVIRKPIDEVWEKITGEMFYEAHRWAAGTPTCRRGEPGESFDRVVDTESGRLMDTITTKDDANHVLEFTVEGLPFFVRSVKSTWTLTQQSDNETLLNMGPRIDVKPGIGTLMQIPMKGALKKLYPQILDDLVTYAETGEPSERKRKELAAS